MDAPQDDVLDLRDYARILQRRWQTIALVAGLVVAAAVGVSLLQTPLYEGTAEVAIEPVRRGADATLEDLILGQSVVETERRVITSRPVTMRVLETLDLPTLTATDLVDKVRVTTVRDTRVITIVATDPDPRAAANIANAYADAYFDYRRDRALDELTAARGNLDARAQDLREQIAEIDRELAAAGTGSGVEADDQSLRAQRQALAQQLAQVEGQLASLDPGTGAIRGGGELLVPAEPAQSPVSPRPLRTGALAVVLGLMLGVGLAFLRDHFDDAIRSEDDVQRAGGKLPVLGRVTHWEDPRADQRLITLVDPHDPISEEFRALAANVRFSLVRRDTGWGESAAERFRKQSVVVTSANPGEGKSSVAANLAVAASASGMRVILVEADLRQPTLAARFGIPHGQGVSDLLVDRRLVTDGDVIAQYLVDVGSARLRVLPAGTIPPNPTDLIASRRMQFLHDTLVNVADLVVYDSPPLLPVADTLELAPWADASLVVVRTGLCHRRELGHAIERLEGVGANVAGYVINDIPQGKRAAYGYGYGYRYGKSYRPRAEGGSNGSGAAGVGGAGVGGAGVGGAQVVGRDGGERGGGEPGGGGPGGGEPTIERTTS